MAFVEAKYTRNPKVAKAKIRYIENRPGKDGQHTRRVLFGHDGQVTREEAYTMIDEAEKGSIFFRFIISPDPKQEDTHKDLHLRDITIRTMQKLEERIKYSVTFAAAIHADHTPIRHVHVIAVVKGRVYQPDTLALIQEATEASLEQRIQLDLVRESQIREQTVQWERNHE
jgi:hypothetical protein